MARMLAPKICLFIYLIEKFIIVVYLACLIGGTSKASLSGRVNLTCFEVRSHRVNRNGKAFLLTMKTVFLWLLSWAGLLWALVGGLLRVLL